MVESEANANAEQGRVRHALQCLANSATMIVWMSDTDNVCTYLSPAAAALFDNVSEFRLRDFAQFIHPEDVLQVGPAYLDARRVGQEYRFEYRLLCSDGTIRRMMTVGAPRFDESRALIGYIGTIFDVTAHHDALQKLLKSEAELRTITENSGDLITHHDSTGKVLYVSPSCFAVTGYRADELIGSGVYDLVHPDDRQRLQDGIRAQVELADSDELFEMRMVRKDGQEIWLGSRASVLLDPTTGVKLGTVSIARDITTDKRNQEELAKREERFRSLTNLSSDWYWETNENEVLTFKSEAKHPSASNPPQALLGHTRVELAANPLDPQFQLYLQKVAAREPFRDIQYECYWAPAKGLLRYISISGEPVFERGVFRGYRGVGRDITGERAAAVELARLAAENRTLVENTVDIMAMLDPDGRFLRLNRATVEILGYTPEEMLGRPYSEFLLPDERDMTAAVDAGLRSGAESTINDFQTRWVRKDGDIRHLSLSVRWADDLQVMFATAKDVTESQLIRMELHKSKDYLSAVLESIGDAFFSVDRDWRATFINQKTAEFIGRPEENLIGQVLWEVVPELLGTDIMAQYERAMSTRKTVSFEAFWAPTRAWVEIRAYPHADGLSVFFHDITERRGAQDAVRESERRLREVIEMTPAGYLVADHRGIIRDVNPALSEMAGYSEQELTGTRLPDLFESTTGGAAFTNWRIVQTAQEATLKHRSGRRVYVLINASYQRDNAGNPIGLTAFITDITERKHAADRLEQLATHDALTGLPNRARLNDHLQSMIEVTDAESNVAVLFIDLDRFKAVNDTMGHDKGDLLLQMVSHRLQHTLRPGDIVARLGGDEFVVAVRTAPGREAAEKIAGKILDMMVASFDLGGQEVFVGASVGISLYPLDGETKELLFQNADTAMYKAKAAGRNGYRFFEAEMSVEARHRAAIETALRRALERNEFEMHYQPRMDLKTGALAGAEALIRWNHPQLGRVPPLQFIPIAEEIGLIEEIGQWVLTQACFDTKQILGESDRPFKVSVNVSARQLKGVDLLDQVKTALAGSGLAPARLELEVTESAIIEDMDRTAGTLQALKALGVSLAVDDFGTGYSGLAYLRRFPLDILKLDRSFVAQHDDRISNSRFVGAFVDLAHALNLSVVAEGVETEETLRLLQDANCDEAQGYYFARPMPLQDLRNFLQECRR